MPNPNVPSFDDLLQESRRKKNLENLAQKILGSGNRSRTPSGPRQQQSINNNLASRAGVAKRPASIPRTNSAPAARPVNKRAPPSSNRSNRPAPRQNEIVDDYDYDDRSDNRERTHYPAQQRQPVRDNNPSVQGNGRAFPREPAAATSFSVRGAAKSDPYIVLAENFAPGTTAADIEAVMLDVGGEMHQCRLISLDPVVAEMTFVDRQGADTVIDTFNGKKADGRTLHVYWKGSATTTIRQQSPEAVGFVVDAEPSVIDSADTMDIDEHTREREEQNRLREERRGPAPRGPANDQPRDSRDRGGRPTGPRNDRGHYDERARYNSNDGRYGNGGGAGDRYGNGGGRPRNDGGRGGRGGYSQHGQSYRP